MLTPALTEFINKYLSYSGNYFVCKNCGYRFAISEVEHIRDPQLLFDHQVPGMPEVPTNKCGWSVPKNRPQ